MTEPDMPQEDRDRRNVFTSQVEAWDKDEELFSDLRDDTYDDEQATVGGLRRRRRRAANSTDEPIKTVSLIEKNGILLWCDDIPQEDTPSELDIGPRRRRLRRRAGLSEVPEVKTPPEMEDGPLVLTRTFPKLAPNRITDAVGRIDRWLNPALGASLSSRLRPLLRAPDGTFTLGERAAGPFEGGTLLFVHGTFSNAENMLGEFTATPQGLAFLNAAVGGQKRYKNVVFFDHPTLAVSPVINALELGRFFTNASGQIDVIAHSRGGLVVRWWLEAFGKYLGVLPGTPVRAVLAGSPLNGTSLAAPDKVQNVLSLLSNIGSYMEATLKIVNFVGPANPFAWVAGKLVQVVVSATGALAKTPLIDGVVALVPGLSGQSMVSNNIEINTLRLGPCVVTPRYYAVQSDFETADPGWKFWRYFRGEKIADMVTNQIFEGPNDLVVDTDSMINFGVPNLQLAGPAHNFGTTDHIWHCNYFRQPQTINYITQSFT
jgi:pimeloyl-ACP methyl ester carboxylesterase